MMDQLSLYFDSQPSAILENSGTIDKFFRDAVMAFWNAPDGDPDMPPKRWTGVKKFEAK